MADQIGRNNSGTGLVKSLLFPAYADSGANNAFRPSASDNGSLKPPSNQQDDSLLSSFSGDAEETEVSVTSNASTLIQNNLSKFKKGAFQQHNASLDTITAQSPPRRADEDELQHSEQPSSFFSSSEAVVGSIPKGAMSPPQVHRVEHRSLSTKVENLSTVVFAGSESDTVVSTDISFDLTQSLSRSMEAESSSEEPATATEDVMTGENTNKVSEEAQERGALAPDTNGEGETASASTADVEAPVLSVDGTPRWEEEATPDQTAFGKELLFRRVLTEETGSDVASTASEMGTVVAMDCRMAELDDMMVSSPSSATKQQADGEAERPTLEPTGDIVQSAPPMPDAFDSSSAPEPTNNDSDEKKVPDKEQPTSIPSSSNHKNSDRTTQLLTDAVRQIGAGLKGSNRGGITSAPGTPRSANWSPKHRNNEPRRRTRRQQGESTEQVPSSLLLGSPSRIASKPLPDRQGRVLSPRFSTLKTADQRQQGGGFHIAPQRSDAIIRPPPPNAACFVPRCFSFDMYDTAMDDQYEIAVPPGAGFRRTDSSVPIDNVMRLKTMDDDAKGNADTVVRSTSSWDVAGASSRSSAFRSSSSYVRHHQQHQLKPPVSPKRPHPNSQRIRMMSDFSPGPAERSKAQELKSPQRIEIEREDALDILACLVERGVSLKHHDGNDTATTAASAEAGATLQSQSGGVNESSASGSQLDVEGVVQNLKDLIVRDAAAAEDGDSSAAVQSETGEVLDELLRAYQYAQEMRRVSRSACSWLASIGRSGSISKSATEAAIDTVSDGQSPDQSEGSPNGINLLTAKALLHSAQLELLEKDEQTNRLNEELAECRAEIGRLTSAANGGAFRSPNRSILDESEDVSDNDDEDDIVDRSFDNASPIPEEKEVDTSFETMFPLKEDASDIVKFQRALEEANDVIRRLHEGLKEAQPAANVPEEAPVVKVGDKHPTLDNSEGRESNLEERTVNVRMLDSENYSTDWDELVPGLPPPPDHGLRSPIVAAVLEQWTADKSLHDSLLSWMEHILSGGDPAAVPPLTLSSLDHQVRDGFAMHVLPLLLRRPDIRVEVKSRVHRVTTYDLALMVDRIMITKAHHGSPLPLRRQQSAANTRSEVGAASVTHSSATAVITNTMGGALLASARGKLQGSTSRLSYDEMADGVESDSSQQPGIMSALGGALGGLLSLRKTLPAAPGTPSRSSLNSEAVKPLCESPVNRVPHAGSLDDEECQPFHRVVTAPPGRLGITFVEYRGHAMVSDVAPESPLIGWVFGGDILIAIDELLVSGMRIRDIIKVLKDRKERPRALRVISSHDMTEFTLSNNTSIHDAPN